MSDAGNSSIATEESFPVERKRELLQKHALAASIHRGPGLHTPVKQQRSEYAAMNDVVDITPQKHGVEAEVGGHFVIDTTLVTMESKDSMSTICNDSRHHDDGGSIISDCATEASSVAHLRGLLDEFGQKNKQHYQCSSSIGSAPPNAKRVTRQRIAKAKSELPPTPLPPAANAALNRKLDSIPRARATPVRIRYQHTNVAATNDERKSVTQLAKWLADDPTKNKPAVTSIRRGANVIAKSRAFDKGLAGIIVEENNIRSGSVRRASQSFDQGMSKVEDNHSFQYEASLETSSSISVSSKKDWLQNAFKKSDHVVEKARTELITDQEKHDEASSRAKQMWRERAGSATKPRENESSSRAKQMWRQRSASKLGLPPVSPRATNRRKSTTLPTTSFPSPAHSVASSMSGFTRGSASTRSSCASHKLFGKENTVRQEEVVEAESRDDESTKEVDFSAARKLLIERSKKNGHNMEVLSKVSMKKAKFERIEKEHRRRSSPHGLLKPRWEGSDSVEGISKDSYVKTYVPNPSAPKSFEELP